MHFYSHNPTRSLAQVLAEALRKSQLCSSRTEETLLLDMADVRGDGMITYDMYMAAVLDGRFPVRRYTLMSEYKGEFIPPEELERRARGRGRQGSVRYSLSLSKCVFTCMWLPVCPSCCRVRSVLVSLLRVMLCSCIYAAILYNDSPRIMNGMTRIPILQCMERTLMLQVQLQAHPPAHPRGHLQPHHPVLCLLRTTTNTWFRRGHFISSSAVV